MTLKEDYLFCENIIRTNSTSFYLAFKGLPLPKRNAVFAVYAFCRLADDSVDIHKSPEMLSELEAELEALEKGQPSDNPVFRALSNSFTLFNLELKPFREMLEGQRRDLDFRQPQDTKELLNYCYLVAGTVGLMLLPIIATENLPKLSDVAISLGEAMQLTNILRDVGEDYRQGRCYLPLDLLHKYGFDELPSEANESFIALWEELAALAENSYTVLENKLALFDKDSRYSLRKASLYYQGILFAVRRNKHDCLTKRAYLNRGRKLLLLLKTFLPFF